MIAAALQIWGAVLLFVRPVISQPKVLCRNQVKD